MDDVILPCLNAPFSFILFRVKPTSNYENELELLRVWSGFCSYSCLLIQNAVKAWLKICPSWLRICLLIWYSDELEHCKSLCKVSPCLLLIHKIELLSKSYS